MLDLLRIVFASKSSLGAWMERADGLGGDIGRNEELGRLDYTLRFLAWSVSTGALDPVAHVRLRQRLERRWIELTAPAPGPGLAPAGWAVVPPAAAAPSPAGPWLAAPSVDWVPGAGPVRPWAGGPGPSAPHPPERSLGLGSAPTAQAPGPVPPVGRVTWLDRARAAVAGEVGLHGLAYLGVLLVFAGTLGLVLFAFGGVNPALRPAAEAAIPVVLFGSAWFLGRRGSRLAPASLELLGGALTPVALFAALVDGVPLPPDVAEGPALIAAWCAIAVAMAVLYALVARRPGRDGVVRPVGYLVAPMLWTAAGVAGLALGGPSSWQMAVVAVAVAASAVWAASRSPAFALARAVLVAVVPGSACTFGLVLTLGPRSGWPAGAAALAGAATVVSAELAGRGLRSRAGATAGTTAGTTAGLAQAAVVLAACLAVIPELGAAPAGALGAIAFLALADWHARQGQRAPVVGADLVACAQAVVLATAATADPGPATLAWVAAALWLHLRRARPLPGLVGRGWHRLLTVGAVVVPIGVVVALVLLLPPGWGLLVTAAVAAVLAAGSQAWRGDRFERWFAPALAAVALTPTFVTGAGPAWVRAATGLAAVLAFALPPIRDGLRVWLAGPAACWTLALTLDLVHFPGPWRAVAFAVPALAAVAVALVRPGPSHAGTEHRVVLGAGHLALLGHVVGTLAALASAPGAPRLVALGLWVVGWAAATVAAEAGRAPLVALAEALLPAPAGGPGSPVVTLVRAVPPALAGAGLAVWVAVAAGASVWRGPLVAAVAVAEALVARALAGRRPLGPTGPSHTGAGHRPVLGAGLSLTALVVSAGAVLDPSSWRVDPAGPDPTRWAPVVAVALAMAAVAALGPRLRRTPANVWAWALSALLTALVADRVGVSGGLLPELLLAWSLVVLNGALAADELLGGRRRRLPGAGVRQAGLIAPIVLSPFALLVALAVALTEAGPARFGVLAMVAAAGWVLAALQLRVGTVGGAALALGTLGAAARWADWVGDHPWVAVPWVAGMVAVAALTDAWARRARAGRGVAPASWTVPVLAAAGAAALAGLLVPLGGLAQPDGTAELAATWAGLGALAVGVAVWRRWPMLAVLGVVVTLAGGAVAGRTWFAAALGWATLVTALWARLRRRPSLRILTALFGAATLQAGLWAAQADAELWTWTDLAGGTLAAMAALAIWRRRVRARWLPALVVFAPLLSAVGLLVAFVAGDTPLRVAALLVAGLQAAVAGLVTGSPWLAASAPVLVCAAWLEFARLSLRGDPQWFTVPIGLALLTVVEIARGHRRRTGQRVAGPELVALELAGMLLVVGAALFQTATTSLLNGLLATLFGAGLLGWGVLTRVRRRASVGAATVALAAFMLVTVPVARMLPAVRGPVLWLTLAAAGLVLLLVASSIERGRARARAAARRIDQLLVGWE